MNETVIVAMISLLGTLFGSMAGVITSGKLTGYRLTQLEKKVDEHTSFARRLPLIEKEQQIAAERISALEQRCITLPALS